MAGIIEALLSGLGGYETGRERKRVESEDRAERERARMMGLLDRPGFQFEPEGALGAQEPALGGVAEAPAMPKVPPMPGTAPPGPMRVGSLDLGELSGAVTYDPTQTREAREERRQRQAWNELPRDEYPQFLEGYDYLAEFTRWQQREREKEEIEARRDAVGKALGLPPDHPDVEAMVRANIDPELARQRRRGEKPSASELRERTRFRWQEEERTKEEVIEEAQGLANDAAQRGESRGVMLLTLQRRFRQLNDGQILAIISRALKDYGGY